MPEGYLAYRPALDSKENYLSRERQKLERRIQDDPSFKLAPPFAVSDFVNTIIEKLEKECEKAEKISIETGICKAPKKFRKLKQLLEWTVRAQVCRKSYTEIATEDGVNPSSVSKQVSSLLELMGLPPRDGLQPGRRKGSKNLKTLANLGK